MEKSSVAMNLKIKVVTKKILGEAYYDIDCYILEEADVMPKPINRKSGRMA